MVSLEQGAVVQKEDKRNKQENENCDQVDHLVRMQHIIGGELPVVQTIEDNKRTEPGLRPT
jgi:hypothetical protein